MSSIFNVNGNSNTDYFSGLFGTTTSGSTGLTSLLGDYYSIQNGTYLKVAKRYYASKAGDDSSSTSATTNDKQTKITQNSAESAVASISKLMDVSLYNKVEKTDEDGNTTKDYDREAILENLKSFVSDYNDLINNLSDDSASSVLKNGVRLTNQTKVYESALKKIGISIKADNTLELDEETFNKADITDVKSLFTGGVSFAKNIQTKFAQIYTSANNEFASSGSIYSQTATNTLSIGNMFDSLL